MIKRLKNEQRGQAITIAIAFMVFAVPIVVAALSLAITLLLDSRIKLDALKSQYSRYGANLHALHAFVETESPTTTTVTSLTINNTVVTTTTPPRLPARATTTTRYGPISTAWATPPTPGRPPASKPSPPRSALLRTARKHTAASSGSGPDALS